MSDIQLSPHFKLGEFTYTWRDEREKNHIIGQTEPYLTNMKLLCTDILEPLRKHFMAPVRISSGFRYAEQHSDGSWEGLDYAIRSVRQKNSYDARSQHTRGEAADIHVTDIPDKVVWQWLQDYCPNAFGQLIFEVSGRSSWIHVSIPGRRIESRGGGLIYGEVKDAKQDTAGRWYYKNVLHKDWGTKLEWDKQTR